MEFPASCCPPATGSTGWPYRFVGSRRRVAFEHLGHGRLVTAVIRSPYNVRHQVIQSFAERNTQSLFRDGVCHRRWRAFESLALRKLDMLDAASALGDLRSPPGNRLEPLRGDRKGQWSIRINDQWRLCFVWGTNGPERVEIVDYH